MCLEVRLVMLHVSDTTNECVINTLTSIWDIHKRPASFRVINIDGLQCYHLKYTLTFENYQSFDKKCLDVCLLTYTNNWRPSNSFSDLSFCIEIKIIEKLRWEKFQPQSQLSKLYTMKPGYLILLRNVTLYLVLD